MMSAVLTVVATLLSLTRNNAAAFAFEAIAEWLDRREKQLNSALEELK